MSDLDARLCAAHRDGDRRALAALYTEAADQAANAEAQGFYLTQAYIFALEAGLASATDLRDRLRRMGRER